jgi:signal transduction histidine kinase
MTIPNNQTQPLTESGRLRRSVSILERRTQQLTRILEINQQMTSTLELEPLLQQIIRAATELTDTEGASIMLYDEKAAELRFAAVTGKNAEELSKMRVPVEGSIAGTIWKTGQPMLITEADKDPRHYEGTDQATQYQTRNILGVPLSIKDHHIGVLEAINKHGDVLFSEEDTRLLSTLAAQAAVAIQNARLVGELQRAYQKLNQLDSLKSDFISIASHELRTPLILGYAAMLRDEAAGPAAEQLEVVLQAALRLRGLIDEMVNLRLLDTGERVIQVATFAIQDLVKTVCGECESITTAKSQAISINAPMAPLLINADPAQVAIVLNNLLTNAIKFTPQGGRISVSVEPRNSEAWIAVADNGIGISPGDLERIFERFYQVEPHLSRSHGGMGLGLSIAKGLVEMHGGRIWAESVKGRGSRFTFTLPTGKPSAERGDSPLPSPLTRLAH